MFQIFKNIPGPVNEKWLRLSGIALLGVNSLLNTRILASLSFTGLLIELLRDLFIAAIVFEGNRFINLYLRKKTANAYSERSRIIRTLLFNTLLNFAVIANLLYFELRFKLTTWEQWTQVMVSGFFSAFISSLFLFGVYEALHYFNRIRQVEKEKEELERVNLQSQFDSLKGQVNPHFLFNSLNSLRQLVLKDPQQAARYVEEMSDVYRYLLRNNDGELTSLQKELDFLQSYTHLLGTRFGVGLVVNIQVQPEYLDYELPPLTLQMLFENAVKHNIISPQQPLRITVSTDSQARLHITNNLQKKLQPVQSEKIGLANIITKYKYLGKREVEILETEKEFIVILPLIKKVVHEHIDR